MLDTPFALKADLPASRAVAPRLAGLGEPEQFLAIALTGCMQPAFWRIRKPASGAKSWHCASTTPPCLPGERSWSRNRDARLAAQIFPATTLAILVPARENERIAEPAEHVPKLPAAIPAP